MTAPSYYLNRALMAAADLNLLLARLSQAELDRFHEVVGLRVEASPIAEALNAADSR